MTHDTQNLERRHENGEIGTRSVVAVDWRTVVTRQSWMIVRAPHRELLILLVLGVIFAVRGCVNIDMKVDELAFPFDDIQRLYLLMIVGAGIWGTSVWQGEGPSRRAYHWSLPIERTRHDLLRVAAGALCLAGALGAILIVLLLVGLIGQTF